MFFNRVHDVNFCYRVMSARVKKNSIGMEHITHQTIQKVLKIRAMKLADVVVGFFVILPAKKHMLLSFVVAMLPSSKLIHSSKLFYLCVYYLDKSKQTTSLFRPLIIHS
jgi:hypothetical protein